MRMVRRLVVVPVIAMAVGISPAGDDDSSDDTTANETVAADVPDVLGDSVEDATATLEDVGLTLRVVRRDGEDLAVTMDFVKIVRTWPSRPRTTAPRSITEVVSVG